MTFQSYLSRVGLAELPEAPLERLRALHRSQVLSIPFENLSPFVGDPVVLDPEALFEKMVVQRRGGYCHELNSLFRWVLQQCGFEPETRLARIAFRTGKPEARSHEVNLVRCDGARWLCDVGFGGPSPRLPIRFERGEISHQEPDTYRVTEFEGFGLGVSFQEPDGGWRAMYAVPEEPALPADALIANYYTSTSPESFFTQSIMAASAGECDRWGIVGRQLQYRGPDGSSIETLESGAALLSALRDHFGLVLEEGLARLVVEGFDLRL